jgi:hypothetical protein
MFELLVQGGTPGRNSVSGQADIRQRIRNWEQLSIIAQPIGSTSLRHGCHAAGHVLLIAVGSLVSQVRFFAAAFLGKKVYSFYAERSRPERRLLQAGL